VTSAVGGIPVMLTNTGGCVSAALGVQVIPLPDWPELQKQMREPGVLKQAELQPLLFVAHSLMSLQTIPSPV